MINNQIDTMALAGIRAACPLKNSQRRNEEFYEHK